MVEEQVEWMTFSYAGRQHARKMSSTASEPLARQKHPLLEPQNTSVDMQIEFVLVRQDNGDAALYAQDTHCAQDSFTNISSAAKYNKADPAKFLTVVTICDDFSGLLGVTTFPTSVEEDSPMNLAILSKYGFKNWASSSGNPLTLYNQGDTAVHEVGHFFGLYHTFEGGCSRQGDLVQDTHPESLPMYVCAAERSCAGALNPVHNYMDYTPDDCMSSFTQEQRNRAWCIAKMYRPTLYALSLRVS